MKNLIITLFVILTSVCFGQIDMKIYKKNGQVEAVPVSQVDSVKYTTSSPLMMNVYKNNNSAILSVLINDIDSIKYLTNSSQSGIITGLDCGNAIINGTLFATTAASGVTSVVPYIGGNGGTHNGQVVSSTGITGLTATLQAGVFANGNGDLTYIISGTPTASGIANFELNIGGKTCLFTRIVAKPTSGYGANITDVEGNSYKTVYIGTQQWMAENLKVTKYNDGSIIPNISDDTQWKNNITGAWAYYNNDVVNNAKYGKLYNLYAVSSSTNGNNKVCPTGWHVPTDDEWTVLVDYLDGSVVAGGKMKDVGTTSWNSPNTNASNTSLFTGLPGGFRRSVGNFDYIGVFGYWWTSTKDYSGNAAWYRSVSNYSGNAERNSIINGFGFSVRCIRD